MATPPYIQAVTQPNYAQSILQGFQAYQGAEQMKAQQARQEAETQERFMKERSALAASIENQPLEAQKEALRERIKMVEGRGGDPSNTQGLLQMLESNDPKQQQQGQFYIQQARKEGEAAGLIRPMATGAGQKMTPIQQNLIAAGYQPGTPEYERAMNKYLFKPQAQTQISIGAEETAEKKELGKLRAQELSKTREMGDLARANLTSLDILDSIEVKQGALEPFKQSIAAFGESLGIDTSSLANIPAGQSFIAESGKVVLNAMQQQKGPQTESDMKQIRSTVATLGNTREANKFINNAARATSLRAIRKQDFFDNYLNEKGTLKGANKAWNDYEGNAPLVSRFKNTKTGLPVFFHEFEEDAMRQTEIKTGEKPTREQILKEWRKLNRGRKVFKPKPKDQPETWQPPLLAPVNQQLLPATQQTPKFLQGLGVQ